VLIGAGVFLTVAIHPLHHPSDSIMTIVNFRTAFAPKKFGRFSGKLVPPLVALSQDAGRDRRHGKE
jgi:hypothetical protein